MALWKDQQGKFHDDMSGEATHLLPPGCVLSSQAEVDAANAPSQSAQLKNIERAIERHMDTVAQAKGYDDRNSCRLYSGFANPYQAEAIKFGQWVANCWALTFQAQTEIVAGTRPMPTITEAVAMLPTMIW